MEITNISLFSEHIVHIPLTGSDIKTGRQVDSNKQTVAISMTLSDFQSHSSTASLFKCDFLYSTAASDKISTDMACLTVFL